MRAVKLNGDFRWLFTAQWPGGQPLRLSSQACTVTTRGGKSLVYYGGMPALRWEDELPVFGSAVGQRQVSLSLSVPKSVAELANRARLEGAQVEIAMWHVGEPWERREPVFSGKVHQATWGVKGQRLDVDLREDPAEDDTQVPNPNVTVNRADWPHAPDGSIGLCYPLVIGQPGVYKDGINAGARTVPGSPGICVDDGSGANPPTWAICTDEIEATEIFLIDTTDGTTSGTFPIQFQYCGLGKNRARVGFVRDVSLNVTHTYYACWMYGAGLARVRKPIRGAGELLQLLLARTRLRVDWPAMLAPCAVLDQLYKVDTYLDSPTGIWTWLNSTLLQHLPVSLVSGPAGIRAVIWRHQALPRHVVADLEVGRNASPVGRVESAGLEIASRLIVSYAVRDDTGVPCRTITTTARKRTSADEYQCLPSVEAEAQSGVTEKAITLDWTADLGTVMGLIHARLEMFGRERDAVTLDLRPDVGLLEPGDVVSLTHAARRGVIKTVGFSANFLRIVVLLGP